jgi:hypothetical protein
MVLATVRRLVGPIAAVVATVALLLPAIAAAQTGTGRKVLAVVAIDSYGDLKQQLTWIGPHVDNPGLAAMLESVLLLSTQGKGLNGLDVKRPLGVIVTSANDDIGIHAAIPVKDLEKLLGSLQGSTGPIEKDGDVRRLTLPSGQDIEIREQDGWAVIGQRGQEFDIADPAKLLSPLVTDYTLAIETHPSVMPESLRALIAAGIQQMAAASANQGRPVDAEALQTALAGLSGVETLTIALALDPQENAVFIENKVIAVNGPKAGSSASSLTVATAATKDGGLPALSAHAVQPLNDSQRRQIVAMLDGALPQGNDKTMQIVATVVRGLVDAMADAGGLDAAVTVDTSVAGQLPLITAGAHIADGPKLEKQVKELFGPGSAIPKEVKAKFDSGKVGKANLHTVTIDVSATPAAGIVGPAVELTLAVTPDYAFLLHGGDVKARLETLLETNGKANTTIAAAEVPGAAIALALDRILTYAASMGVGPQAEAAAEQAGSLIETDKDSGSVKASGRPIDGGFVTRLTVGAGALKAAATMAQQQQQGIGGPGGRGAPPRRVPAEREPAGAR